jgi:thiol-disulfide isomerase/thioredoxin
MMRSFSLNRRLFCTSLILLTAAATLLPAANIPRPAPDLAFKLVDGSTRHLSQFRGKVVVLEFLITTCPHCKNTSRLMSKLQNEYAARGVQMLGVAINEMPRLLIPEYVTETGANNFPVGYGEHNTAVDFLQHPPMLILRVPQVVFIDRKGVIRAQRGGMDDDFFNNEEKVMRETIQKLLTGASPATTHKAVPKK